MFFFLDVFSRVLRETHLKDDFNILEDDLNYALTLMASHCFLVGKRQTGVFPEDCSSANFSAMEHSNTLSDRVLMMSSLTFPHLTLFNSAE